MFLMVVMYIAIDENAQQTVEKNEKKRKQKEATFSSTRPRKRSIQRHLGLQRQMPHRYRKRRENIAQ